MNEEEENLQILYDTKEEEKSIHKRRPLSKESSKSTNTGIITTNQNTNNGLFYDFIYRDVLKNMAEISEDY